MAAYVEIIFDNSDGKVETITSFNMLFFTVPTSYMNKPFYRLFEGELSIRANRRDATWLKMCDFLTGRLSVESDEVVLRRTVGHKKDEFFLNRKRVQKSEVQSLLETAGFSKSNPYYIVQQGKVKLIINDRQIALHQQKNAIISISSVLLRHSKTSNIIRIF